MTLDSNTSNFLTETKVAVISTVDANNRPRTAPIWYSWEDGAAYLFTGRNTLKWRNILNNPQVSLCVDRREPPYKSVIIDGTAEEVRRNLYDLVLSMAVRYYGRSEGLAFAEEYKAEQTDKSDAREDVVIFRIIPTKIACFDSDE